jgi:hypothetical protein
MAVIHPHLARDPVRAFAETIVVEAGFGGLEPEAKAELVAALMLEAQQRIGADLLETMDAPSLEDFRRLTERESSEDEMTAFFQIRFPAFSQRVQDVLNDFGAECLEASRNLAAL